MTASVTHGHALRHAEGAARGLLNHHQEHCRSAHAPQLTRWIHEFFTRFVQQSHDAAENFLLRPRLNQNRGEPKQALQNHVFALRMRDADALHAALGEEAFTACLRRVAEALSAETRRAEAFLTYRGEGVFICLPRREVLIDPASLVRRVNERLARTVSGASGRRALLLAVDAMETDDKVFRAASKESVEQGRDGAA